MALRSDRMVERKLTRRDSLSAPQTRISVSGNAIAGVLGGLVSSTIMHPLDVVTTRMQAYDGRLSHLPRYRNPFSALRTIARTEGFAHLYAGLVPNVVGSMTCWGINFFSYNYFKSHLRRYRYQQNGLGKELGPTDNLICATAAGVVATCATQPIWLVKTRLELQEGSRVQYRGMFDCIRYVVQNEGFFALYRGLAPSLMLVSHVGLHFMAYEELKIGLRSYNGGDEHLSAEQTVLAASAAKGFATMVTYPTQVVRTRLQQVDPLVLQQAEHFPYSAVAGAGAATAGGPGGVVHCQALFAANHGHPYYKGVGDALHKIVLHEGVRGLYRGMLTNFLRVIPTTAITFLVYESVAKSLGIRT